MLDAKTIETGVSYNLPYEFRRAFAAEIKQGYKARGDGGDCPYSGGEPEELAWEYGWNWADRRLEPPLWAVYRPLPPRARRRAVARAEPSGKLYDDRRAPAIEALARIEGQSNFLSLLAGVEAGPDTTEPMATLSFARAWGCIPESLEAHIGKSLLYRLPLMSIVADALGNALNPEDGDWPWIRGAIADAFYILRDGRCVPAEERAKQYGVRKVDYSAVRKTASGVFDAITGTAWGDYYRARRWDRESPGIRHNVGEDWELNSFGMAAGCYAASPLSSGENGEAEGFDTCGLGVHDNTGYYARNDRVYPVLHLTGEEAAAHCRLFPSQSKRPYSL